MLTFCLELRKKRNSPLTTAMQQVMRIETGVRIERGEIGIGRMGTETGGIGKTEIGGMIETGIGTGAIEIGIGIGGTTETETGIGGTGETETEMTGVADGTKMTEV